MEAVYGWTAALTIEGKSEIGSQHGYALQLFGEKDMGPGRITANEGTYSGAAGAANWNEMGHFDIYGGTWNGSVDSTITRHDIAG